MPSDDPSLSLAQRIDAICDRFEADWRAGRQARLDDYLKDVPASEQQAVRSALDAVRKELETQHHSVDSSGSQDSKHVGAYQPSRSLPERIGRFEILALLGEGAFGRVYKAYDSQLDREVAIKVPKLEAFAAQFNLQRFLREAKSAAAIQHPNICPVHEVNVEGDQPYIVMPLIQNKSLAEHLKSRTKPLSPKQAALIVRKLALALQVAHDKGIVHRDLKPANILFDPQRTDVVITDFGLAVRTSQGDVRETHSGMLLGTPAYMSPEQTRGDVKQVGPASDLFALGVILYELLTNQRPFQGSLGEVIGQIQHVEPPSIRSLHPAVDERLDAVCRQAMAKSPGDRFPSMKALADALDAYLRDQPTAATTSQKAKGTNREQSVEMTHVLAALSADRRAATEAAVEAAVRRVRPPTRLFVLIGLLIVGSIAVLGGIIFYARTPTATVMINIDVDLNDKTLSFLLDGKHVSAESLQAPIELKVGRHELLVKRGAEVIRKFTFTVSRDAGSRIELCEETPRKEDVPSKPSWTPLIGSTEDLVEGQTISENDTWRSVVFRDGKLELRGDGAFFRPSFAAQNYIIRARIHEFAGQNVLFRVRLQPNGRAGYGGYFHWGDRNLDWPTCGIGKVPVGGAWQDKAISLKQVSDTLPVEFGVAVHGNKLTVYVNGELMTEWSDLEFAEGSMAVRLTGDGRVVLSDLEVCTLDGTSLTPLDIFPQVEEPEINRRLSPEFLTKQLQASNLLKNGDFEAGDVSGWTFESWRDDKSTVAVVDDNAHTGRMALRIRADQNDSIALKQTVRVSPNRWYLLSGWISTQNLKFWERDHQGAHLYVWGHHRHQSRSVPANADWTYFAVIFDSGRRQSVDVAARLGAFAGTMTGAAWFDDLCLIELSEPIAAEDDLAHWQGTWQCVAEHSRGQRLTDEELKPRGTLMRIAGNHREVERTLAGRFTRYSGTFTINSAASPKEFDYEDESAKGVKNYHRGVYEFDGERLRLIYRHAQGSPPQRADWKDIGQPNVVWFEFERMPVDPDRTFAVWLLSLPSLPGSARAVFVTTEDGQRRRLDDLKLLPSGKFRVTQIDLWGNRNLTDANVDPILDWLERSMADTVSFHGNAIGDVTVGKLVQIRTLKSIWLGGTTITDRSLELLATRPDLRSTGFDGTNITDAGVAHLARMTALESLSFYNTPLTDEALKHLTALKTLRTLVLGVTAITPQGLRQLKDLPIERLNIIACHAVASDLKVLKEFPRLRFLEASGLALIDNDASLLAELQTLDVLALNQNRLSDVGLQKLTMLSNLKELAIVDNPVTAEGVARFQEVLPRCVVHWDKK